MSILAPPRLHFSGTFTTNVDTANNDDIVQVIDDVVMQVDTAGMSDDEFIRWMEEYVQVGSSPQRKAIRASWNYYGTNGCGFENCVITSADMPDGRRLVALGEEPLIGANVFLGLPTQRNTGIMVDLDPEGSLATQIFADAFRVESSGTEVLKGVPTVAHSRWLSFQRNIGLPGFTGASAVWQMAMPTASLRVAQGISPTLDALRALAGQKGGLVVRYCIYALSPRVAQSALAERFLSGQKDQNPAVGRVVGTIGVWDSLGELASASAGRRLHPAGSVSFDHMPVGLGPAAAAVHPERDVVSLDLVTAFPELNESLQKVDFGSVTLAVTAAAGGVIRLGQVDYGQESYETAAGVVEIGFPATARAALATGRLQLIHDASGVSLLEEAGLSIDTDDRNLYLEQGESREVTLRFTRHGVAPGERLSAAVLHYVMSNKMQPSQPTPPDRQIVQAPERVECDERGFAVFQIQAAAPGICALSFIHEGDTTGEIDATLGSFFNVRVFPADDYSDVPDGELTFAFIYQEVLRYYHLLYPGMSRIFALNREDVVRENAEAILERIDVARWAAWDYMPRTREMSAGKRQLLKRWLEITLA